MLTCGFERSNFSLAIALLVIYLINNQQLRYQRAVNET
jgi:hypothetical protein